MTLSKILALIGAMSLSACGATGVVHVDMPDGTRTAAATLTPNLDRSVTVVGDYRRGPDGSWVQVGGAREIGPTVAGSAIVGATGGIGSALIQRNAAIRTAEIKTDNLRCPDGTQVCHSQILSGGAGGDSYSQSIAGAESEVDFNATLSGSCPDGRCASVPMH